MVDRYLPSTVEHGSTFEHDQARFAFALREIERLRDELYRVTVDRDHWYAAANYTPEELHEMHMRASQGRDENGAWLWPDGLRTLP
ncbi:hypothetical protein [Microbacterium sp. NPDC057650]|uniref:hypothetical protein n=1 Tax=unclassified Microbacterium TaxID=2609290 RepID=UPI00366E60E1